MRRGNGTLSELDERDIRIVSDRMTAYWKRNEKPQTGDWIRFADGAESRIAYVWRDDAGWEGLAQICSPAGDAGSFHLGEYGLSYSGSLDPGVPTAELRPAYEVKGGRAWIFHHNHRCAGNGVDMFIPNFNVWLCDRRLEDAQ